MVIPPWVNEKQLVGGDKSGQGQAGDQKPLGRSLISDSRGPYPTLESPCNSDFLLRSDGLASEVVPAFGLQLHVVSGCIDDPQYTSCTGLHPADAGDRNTGHCGFFLESRGVRWGDGREDLIIIASGREPRQQVGFTRYNRRCGRGKRHTR